MLDEIEAVLSEQTVLTVIDCECAVADYRIYGCSQKRHVKSVGGNSLPGEVAIDTKTANICQERQVLSFSKLVSDPTADKRILRKAWLTGNLAV